MRAGASIVTLGFVILASARASVASDIDFAHDIAPILAEKCYACHGPDDKTRKARLRLDRREDALDVLSPNDLGESELLARLKSDDPDERMPPASTKKEVTARELDLLKRWLRNGARYAEHWAFASPRRVSPPKTSNDEWCRGEIDRFVLARLDSSSIVPSAPADRRTLVRRVTLDLTGLPPTPEEVERFAEDDSADAYEKLVDRLLSTTAHAEHVASPWLDASRYADTDGYQNDRYRYQSAWRDWLILAIASAKPYDEFVTEQLAGDMLPNATLRQQVASGFGRNHRINSEAGSIPDEWHVEYVVDRVDTFGTVFLGLTVGCGRCHTHKYDPISHEEYYRLFAYFNNVPEWGVGPNNGNSPPFVTLPESWPLISDEEDRAIGVGPLEFQKPQNGGGVIRPKPGKPGTVMVMAELPEPRPTFRLERGQYRSPDKSKRLSPGVPTSLAGFSQTSPRDRLELARWLLEPGHPLTARGAVNRLWQRLFGTGLVKTSDNFGTRGETPSHPELLDWLSVELVENGWDLVALEKAIVLSETYRQSSKARPDLDQWDPENRLLARSPRRRLPAFALRDQALAVSGLLETAVGGPSTKPYMPPRIWRAISNNTYKQDSGDKLYRRSLYTYWRRTIPPPTMVNFNAALREVCSVRTEKTNTPLQALTVLNNVVFVETARFLAERMIRDGGETIGDRIHHGARLATGRAPESKRQKLLGQAHAIFLKHYREHPDDAKKLLAVGEKKRDPSLDPVELAAMTMVASTLLNLDETITQE